jgi:hypothetical protein
MKTEKIILFNESTLELEVNHIDDFYKMFYFITKKNDPSLKTLSLVNKALEDYKGNRGIIENENMRKIFEKFVLKFPALHSFEDIYGPDPSRRRIECLKMEEFTHKVFSHNKFYNDNIRYVVTFIEWHNCGEKVRSMNNQVKEEFADMMTSDGLRSYESWSFDKKTDFVRKITSLSLEAIDSVLQPVHA